MNIRQLKRYLYIPAFALVGCSVIVAAFTMNGNNELALLQVAALLSLLWLSWYCARQSGQIKAIQDVVKQAGPTEIDDLPGQLTEAFDSFVRRIDELNKHVEDLRIQVRLWQRQKHNVEAIIYGIRDAVIVTDGFDRLLMANEAAGKLFGFNTAKSQQQPIAQIVNHSELTALIHQSRQNKTRHIRREISLADDNEPRTFECIISCIDMGLGSTGPTMRESNPAETSEVCQMVAVLHDITREKEISEMKNEFISHVSHELKTPLASINAYAEMLADGEAEDEKTSREFCSIIQTQTSRLSRLIEDILDISRIESGLIKVNKEAVSMTVLIREAVEMMKSYAAEKDIEMIEQNPIVFAQAYADKDMILRVIINLLSNAVKYTPQGGSVRIETCANEADGVVRVSVIDTGVGIGEDEIGHVFDKFYRVDANRKRAKGTGLGLNLVKQIVEKVHSGRIFVTSERDVGSTFGFELPMAKTVAAEVL